MSNLNDFQYITDNIIIGKGEVPAKRVQGGIVWMLPGGKTTSDRQEAIDWAVRLDQLISANLKSPKKFPFS